MKIRSGQSNKFQFVFPSPLRNNTPQGISLSLNQRKREPLPDGCSIRVDGGTDGGNVVGIHGPGDAAVLGIDVADGDEFRLDGAEDGHGL